MRHAIMRSALRSGSARRRSNSQEADGIRLVLGGGLCAIAYYFGSATYWAIAIVLGVVLGCLPSQPSGRKPRQSRRRG